jgi:hypothetical protein
MRLRVLILLMSLAAVLHSRAKEVAAEVFPFEFREGLLWVAVQVPQTNRVLHFLLDSGAEASVVDLTTAKSLGLKLGARVDVRGVRTSTEAYWSGIVWAKAGSTALPNRWLALDLAPLSGSCERRVDGLIGLDFFRNKIVQIDFRDGKVRRIDAGRDNNQVENAAVALEVRRCGMCIRASINGQRAAPFRVDTGCASGLQWVVGSKLLRGCPSKLAVGLAELGIPQTRTKVKIGNHELVDVETGLHDTAIFEGESGLLGNSVLCQFETLTIDAVRGKLVLGPRRAPSEATAH